MSVARGLPAMDAEKASRFNYAQCMAGKSKEHNIHPQMSYIIWAMIRRDGRDPAFCELGNHPLVGRPTLHHTKYEGATYYDLLIACYSCQLKKENKLLL
jgi:hypothetical protein